MRDVEVGIIPRLQEAEIDTSPVITELEVPVRRPIYRLFRAPAHGGIMPTMVRRQRLYGLINEYSRAA